MNLSIEYKLVNDIAAETGIRPAESGPTVEYLNRHGWIRTPEEAEAALKRATARLPQKYIDLADRIAVDTDSYNPATRRALRWLDEHLEAVPVSAEGPKPTMTESEYRAHETTIPPSWVVAFRAFVLGCYDIVPDPEPTNAEWLATLLVQTYHPDRHKHAENLDSLGVKAPEAGDE